MESSSPERTQLKPVWVRPLAAGIAIAALGITAWFAIGAHAPAATEQIPPHYQAEVQAAIDSGVLHIPIQFRSDTQPAASSTFHLISPTATAAIDDTPTFRWTPLAGATYSISVYNDHFIQIASANSLHATEWHPDKPFARGAVYLWEVRADRGGQAERAPAVTEPEARFAILSAADAQRLAAARAAMPDEPLALGIIYADAGVLADAKIELQQATNHPQQKSAARKLLRQLK